MTKLGYFHFFCFFTVAFLSLQVSLADRRLDGKLASVNNTLILRSDLTELEKTLKTPQFLDELPLGTLNTEELKLSEKAKIEYLIRAAMLDSEVSRLNLQVTQDMAEQRIKEIYRGSGLNKDQFISEVTRFGISYSDYQDYFKRRLERQQFVDQEILSKVKVSEDDLQAAYAAQFGKAPAASFEAELSHIFFNPKKGGAEGARERADAVLAKIEKGQSFESLVAGYSEDANLSEKGFLGTFNKSDLEPLLAEAITQMTSLGVIMKVIKGKTGYHIFKLNSKKILWDQEYLKRKAQLQGAVLEKQMRIAIEKWFEQKRDQFVISIVTSDLAPKK